MIAEPKQTESRPLTKREIVEFFNVTQRTIEVWMNRGLVPHLKIGQTVRFDLETVKAHMRENCQVGGRK